MWLILLLIASPLLIPLAILLSPFLIVLLMFGYLLFAALVKLEDVVDDFSNPGRRRFSGDYDENGKRRNKVLFP